MMTSPQSPPPPPPLPPLPDLAVLAIFAHLPLVDLFRTIPLVCTDWHRRLGPSALSQRRRLVLVSSRPPGSPSDRDPPLYLRPLTPRGVLLPSEDQDDDTSDKEHQHRHNKVLLLTDWTMPVPMGSGGNGGKDDQHVPLFDYNQDEGWLMDPEEEEEDTEGIHEMATPTLLIPVHQWLDSMPAEWLTPLLLLSSASSSKSGQTNLLAKLCHNLRELSCLVNTTTNQHHYYSNPKNPEESPSRVRESPAQTIRSLTTLLGSGGRGEQLAMAAPAPTLTVLRLYLYPSDAGYEDATSRGRGYGCDLYDRFRPIPEAELTELDENDKMVVRAIDELMGTLCGQHQQQLQQLHTLQLHLPQGITFGPRQGSALATATTTTTAPRLGGLRVLVLGSSWDAGQALEWIAAQTAPPMEQMTTKPKAEQNPNQTTDNQLPLPLPLQILVLGDVSPELLSPRTLCRLGPLVRSMRCLLPTYRIDGDFGQLMIESFRHLSGLTTLTLQLRLEEKPSRAVLHRLLSLLAGSLRRLRMDDRLEPCYATTDGDDGDNLPLMPHLRWLSVPDFRGSFAAEGFPRCLASWAPRLEWLHISSPPFGVKGCDEQPQQSQPYCHRHRRHHHKLSGPLVEELSDCHHLTAVHLTDGRRYRRGCGDCSGRTNSGKDSDSDSSANTPTLRANNYYDNTTSWWCINW